MPQTATDAVQLLEITSRRVGVVHLELTSKIITSGCVVSVPFCSVILPVPGYPRNKCQGLKAHASPWVPGPAISRHLFTPMYLLFGRSSIFIDFLPPLQGSVVQITGTNTPSPRGAYFLMDGAGMNHKRHRS